MNISKRTRGRVRLLCIALSCVGLLAACDDPTTSPPSWNTVSVSAEDQGAFLCAWGDESGHKWVVGGQPEAHAVYHFNGTSWSRANLPDGPLLNWAHGSGDTVWFVGAEGQALRQADGEVSTTDTGVDAPLWGVWSANADEAWAVGGEAIGSGEEDPVLLHWKNETWTRVPIPDTDRRFRALFKVWGTSPENVYAVGSKGIILHYDGSQWVQELSGTARDLISLWGTGPDEILIAGGRANGILVRWDGQTWSNRVLEGEPGMNGVWMDDEGVATVVGIQGRVLRVGPGGFEYTREINDERTLLHGVWGDGRGARIAVGGTLDSSPPWTGIVVEDGL